MGQSHVGDKEVIANLAMVVVTINIRQPQQPLSVLDVQRSLYLREINTPAQFLTMGQSHVGDLVPMVN
tara:strand:+ start:706 stop:909 length:204 start_codon:yes stop_codon:yes gene_type:complete